MLIKQHKSGQATIVLIVVTMMTVLGVAVASSSQSRINLRDTVYSTQSVQALSCAEAGADRALVDSSITSDQVLSPSPKTIASTDGSGSYTVEGCDGYQTQIANYPTSNPGKVTILSIPEGNTQEFNISGFTGTSKEIRFKSNDPTVNSAVAVYVYSGSAAAPVVSRTMIFCNDNQSNQAPQDFTEVTSTSTITLDDGTTTLDHACATNITIPSGPIVMRVRPLFADVLFQVPSFQGTTGYKVTSNGTSGQVQRTVTVTRFYGQLSGAFDEAIVSGETIEDN